MDQTTAVLLAAGVGAGGAIVGQMVAATFNQRSANKRLEWERGGRFADVKRGLFARLLNTHWELYRGILIGNVDTEEAYERHESATGTLVNEIALLAPSLASVVGALEAAAAEAVAARADMPGEVGVVDGVAMSQFDLYRETIEACRDEMAGYLNGPD